MAKVTPRASVELTVQLTVTEAEARALDGLIGYGADAFVKVFYEKLGKHYMEPHEAGLRLFFQTVGEAIPFALKRADVARQAFLDPSPNDVRHALDRIIQERRDRIAGTGEA